MDIEEIKKIKLEPGEHLVLRVNDYFSNKQYEGLKKILEKIFEKEVNTGAKIIVLEKGMDLEKVKLSETVFVKEETA